VQEKGWQHDAAAKVVVFPLSKENQAQSKIQREQLNIERTSACPQILCILIALTPCLLFALTEYSKLLNTFS